ncbi:MAG TPA: hypothetical protein VM509_07260 [Planctomycetota bacterium]|nr:hypothetical protein [Planctomycetota bacterium]
MSSAAWISWCANVSASFARFLGSRRLVALGVRACRVTTVHSAGRPGAAMRRTGAPRSKHASSSRRGTAELLETLARELRHELGTGVRAVDGELIVQGALTERLAACLAKRGAARIVIGN